MQQQYPQISGFNTGTSYGKPILSAFSRLKYGFLLGLLLLTGNHHHAGVKYEQDYTFVSDLSFLAPAQPAVHFNPDYLDYLENTLGKTLESRRFNGVVLVAREGHAVFQRAYGTADFSDGRKIQQEDIFQLASVSKQFTAIATLMLHESGLLSVEDSVIRHIPEFPYPSITIRHLLNHTSGLQNYMYMVDNFWKKPEAPTNEDILKMFTARKPGLNFSPGRRFDYSNTGYAFLALIIERVSGLAFADFMHTYIFGPLEMKNSFALDLRSNNYPAERVVRGHEPNGRSMRVINLECIDGVSGDKGIFSNAEDLLKWDNALNTEILVSKETLQMAFENGKLNSGHKIPYGFGYRLRNQNQQEIQYHNGWWRGFRTAYVRIPQENMLIVVLNNTISGVVDLTRRIEQIALNAPVSVLDDPTLASH